MPALVEDITRAVNYKEKRLLVLLLHLYSEYFLNELIKLSFPNYERILDMTFANKLKILLGLRVISDDGINNNLKSLNKIRNLCVHTLELDTITEEITESVLKMKEIGSDKIKASKLPENDLQKLQLYSLSTIIALYGLSENLKRSNSPPQSLK